MEPEILRMLRKAYNLSGKDFAKVIEISPGYLSEIETGRKKPSIEVVQKYADAFNLPLSSVFFLSERFIEYRKNGGEIGDFMIDRILLHTHNKG